jgi:dUTP pyrophosphatase
MNNSAGRFLGYTATDRNVYYLDGVTQRIKLATHCVFDEAGMTLPPAEHTPAITALQHAGWPPYPTAQLLPEPTEQSNIPGNSGITRDHVNQPTESDKLRVKCLSDQAKMPVMATDGSKGYDVYSTSAHNTLSGERICIPLDIAISPPAGTYAQLVSRSSSAIKYHLVVHAGVIDPDHNGNVAVVLQNNGLQPYMINPGDRIAQMLLSQIQTPYPE